MKALILIDIQQDFMPNGALAVDQGDQIIPIVNILMTKYNYIVATQDWHPENHISFASNHLDKNPFDTIEINGKPQTLWPAHCVAGSEGADFHKELKTNLITAIFRKGTDNQIDSYSGFYDNHHLKSTGLAGYLKELKITELHFAGLAADYCVYYSIKDALEAGFKVKLYEKATRAISVKNFEKQKKELLKNDDFELITTL